MEIVWSIARTGGVIFLALMILNVMILVHEWGHFLAARWRGLKIDAFQIWFGKPIWKKTINGVQYGLGTIPAGGFVKLPQMAPMDAIEGESKEPREALPTISPLDKIIVAFAGPLFSFLLAALFAVVVWKIGYPLNEPKEPTKIGFIDPNKPAATSGLKVGDVIKKIDDQPVERWSGQLRSVQWSIVSSTADKIKFTVERDGKIIDDIYSSYKYPDESEEAKPSGAKKFFSWIFNRPPLKQVGIAAVSVPRVGDVMKHSPAEEAGIKADDLITAVNGQAINHTSQLAEALEKAADQAVSLTIKRGESELNISLTPRKPDQPKGYGKAESGLLLYDKNAEAALTYPSPITQIKDSLTMMKNLLGSVISPKSDLSPAHMGGPIMIVNVYSRLLNTEDGWHKIFWFSVLLNINLAVMNMLPFPVLDGGHITMALIEMARRKALSWKLLEWVQTACVLVLLTFFLTVTLKDIGDVGKLFGESREMKFLPKTEAAK
jgi:regulator of sigma E protease